MVGLNLSMSKEQMLSFIIIMSPFGQTQYSLFWASCKGDQN